VVLSFGSSHHSRVPHEYNWRNAVRPKPIPCILFPKRPILRQWCRIPSPVGAVVHCARRYARRSNRCRSVAGTIRGSLFSRVQSKSLGALRVSRVLGQPGSRRDGTLVRPAEPWTTFPELPMGSPDPQMSANYLSPTVTKFVAQSRRGNRGLRRATQPLVQPRLSAISAPCTGAGRSKNGAVSTCLGLSSGRLAGSGSA
jgi:hypothetical protein